MTKEFTTLEQLLGFMVTKLYGYYDTQLELEDVHDVSSDNDYLEGLIDATQIFLIKSGVDFMDYNQYIEYTDSQKWTKA